MPMFYVITDFIYFHTLLSSARFEDIQYSLFVQREHVVCYFSSGSASGGVLS